MITRETRLVAGSGTIFIDGTTEKTSLHHATIEANEDTTFTSITGEDEDGNEIDLMVKFAMTGKTLKDGKMLYTSLDFFITKIKLATGSIFVH